MDSSELVEKYIQMTAKKRTRLSLVEPNGIQAKEAENKHIISNTCDDGEPQINGNGKTACGLDLVKSVRMHLSHTCKTANSMRTLVADLENKGKSICGNCVSTLYSDGK